MAEYKEKMEAEAEQREQDEKQHQVECFMFLRLLKEILKWDREIDGCRQTLFGHKTFNAVDAFRMFDKDNKGYLTEEDLQEGFKNGNEEVADLNALCDDEGKISYQEFVRLITPSSHDCRDGQPNLCDTMRMTAEAKQANQQAAMDSLACLFGTIILANCELELKREKCGLDGDKLFDSMDSYRQGAVSCGQFNHWIQDNCNYTLKADELNSLRIRFDKNNEHRISREAFVEEVNALEEEEAADDEKSAN